MQINVSANEIQAKIRIAITNATQILESAKVSLEETKKKSIIAEVDRQNKIWWRNLLKNFVTVETVELPMWFYIDVIEPHTANVDTIAKDISNLRNLQSSLVGAKFACTVLVTEKEMNLINKYQ